MSSDMRFLVRRGVPVDLRGCIWFQVSGAHVKMSKAEAQRREGEASYFQQKVQDVEGGGGDTVAQRDILKDIGRTWMSNVMHMDPAFRLRLKNVLMCYSLRNPQIGYCQSMNFIAALFLLFLDEERTFWLLATLVRGVPRVRANWQCGCIVNCWFRWRSCCLSSLAAVCSPSCATKKFSPSACARAVCLPDEIVIHVFHFLSAGT